MKTLHKSERMKNVFKELPIVSYKRNKNIKDILVHRKHSIQFYNRENGCKRCGKNCALCKHLIESSKFQDNEEKSTTFMVISTVKQLVSYIVYFVQNVITIFTSARQGTNFSKIRTKKTKDPVENHFCNNNHTVENYKVIGIERVNGDVILREVKESFWIKKLKTYEPQGLNKKLDRH